MPNFSILLLEFGILKRVLGRVVLAFWVAVMMHTAWGGDPKERLCWEPELCRLTVCDPLQAGDYSKVSSCVCGLTSVQVPIVAPWL